MDNFKIKNGGWRHNLSRCEFINGGGKAGKGQEYFWKFGYKEEARKLLVGDITNYTSQRGNKSA